MYFSSFPFYAGDSFVGKGQVIKGLRKHMGPRIGIVHYRYVHYFVRLREGRPPKHYYPPPLTGYEKMAEYVKEQRGRRIRMSLWDIVAFVVGVLMSERLVTVFGFCDQQILLWSRKWCSHVDLCNAWSLRVVCSSSRSFGHHRCVVNLLHL
jgi:hypothetical protein